MRPFRCVTIICLLLPRLCLSQDGQLRRSEHSRLHCIDARSPENLRAILHHTGESLPLVSGHRGGADRGFPENCIATFENTLRQTYAFLEVDPRFTRDGEIVLHHDADLERTTTGQGLVADFNLAELRELRVKDGAGEPTEYRIPTLDEALDWARGKTVLVLDQKDVPVEARVRKITEHRAEAWTIVIVYSFDDARKCHALNPDIMMEVMIPSREKFEQFAQTGVPWDRVIAFVGHTLPEDAPLYQRLHGVGVCCLAGTSRNLDHRFLTGEVASLKDLASDYRACLQRGVDLFETDIPGSLGTLLYADTPVPAPLKMFFSLSR